MRTANHFICALLLLVVSIGYSQTAQVRYIPGSYQSASATGAGTNGVASIPNYVAPDGINRAVVIFVNIERDHFIGGVYTNNNYAGDGVIQSGTYESPGLEWGGELIHPSDRLWGAVGWFYNLGNPFNVIWSNEIVAYVVLEDRIPSNGGPIRFVDQNGNPVNDFNLPRDIGDDMVLGVATFENVIGYNTQVGISGAANASGVFNTVTSHNVATNGANNMVLSTAFTSADGIPSNNNLGQFFSIGSVNSINFSGTGATPVSEADGVSQHIMAATGFNGIVTASARLTNPQTAVVHGVISGRLNGAESPDYGDAPLSYGEPRHAIEASPTTYMGLLPAESDPMHQGSANADGDDTDGTDEEDGVILPISLISGVNDFIDVAVTEATLGSAVLSAWVDWNLDGDFEDANEQIAVDVADNSTNDNDATIGNIRLSVTPPIDATVGTTYARFRWSTETGLSFGNAAMDGEVEDYQATVRAIDLGISLNISNSIINGVEEQVYLIEIRELLGGDTDTTIPIEIQLDRLNQLSFVYDPTATVINFDNFPTTVNNSQWTFDDTDPNFFTWRNLTGLSANEASLFGFEAVFDSGNTNGETGVTARIVPGSGGESNFDNNISTFRIIFFSQ